MARDLPVAAYVPGNDQGGVGGAADGGARSHLYCVCCFTYPDIGHKDVMAKKKPQAVRGDKVTYHPNARHDVAVAKYEQSRR